MRLSEIIQRLQEMADEYPMRQVDAGAELLELSAELKKLEEVLQRKTLDHDA